jgi:iron complex transport system substrate-binding protein
MLIQQPIIKVTRARALLFILMSPVFVSSAHAGVLTDETGRRVNVPAHPQRIVSLAPDITEILFALGLEKEVVGVTRFSD